MVACAADRGDLALKGRVQDSPVEQRQGVQGLPLGGGRHLALGDQRGANALHLRGPESVGRGLAAVVMERATYPVAIGLLGTVGVVRLAEPLAHLVHPRAAGIRTTFRLRFLLTFHHLRNNVAIGGNPQGKTPDMDSKQVKVPDRTMNMTRRGKCVHL